MDFNKIKKIYMIGIKGVGMTMLAQFFSKNGIEVSGSDTKDIFMTDEILKREGISVYEFNENNIPKDAGLIIYSSAYNKENNFEVKLALEGKIKTITFAQGLGEVFNQRYGIAIVGSHGKTTTTAWLGFVLDKGGLKPNVMVGSKVGQFNGSSLVSSSDYLIIEADEYQNKLRYYNPKAVLLNNIDYDHPDFFSSEEDYINVFIEFIKKIPKKGFLVVNFDDKISKKITVDNTFAKVISYAIDSDADYIAYDIKQDNNKIYFKVKIGLEEFSENNDFSETNLGDFAISLIGKHNIYNALAVIAASIELGVNLVDIRKYLEEFKGTTRRMEHLGEFKGAIIYDDYAHHPTEIKATLSAFRNKFPKNNIIVVFHPHTFTRTKALLDDFSKSFPYVQKLIILDIYGSAREQQGGVHSQDLIEKIKLYNQEIGYEQEIKYIPTIKECEKYLRENIERADVIILMGAGDVFRIGEKLLKN